MTVQPASNISKWYAITDAKIFPMLTDPPDDVPTYGPAHDVPGIKSLIVSGSTDTKELRGDNMLLDTSTVITSMDGTMEYAKLDLDVQVILVGGETQEQIDPPASAWDWGTSDYANAGYWMVIGRTPTADTPTGDCWLMIYKCKVTSFPEIGFAEEDYKTFSVDFSALELQGVRKTLGIRYNDEAGNIIVPTFCPAAVSGALDDLGQLVPADCSPASGSAPTLTTVAPATGGIAGGTATTLTGTGFTGATGVTFGGTPGTAFSVTNPTTIAVTAPAHAAGAVSVVVQHPNGNATKATAYTYA